MGVLGYSYLDPKTVKSTGVRLLFQKSKARAFSAFESVPRRFGHSRPSSSCRTRSCLHLTQGSSVLGLHPLAEFGRSRLCLRLTQGSGVLGPLSFSQSTGVLSSASTPHQKDSTPLQKPRIAIRDRLNARPNPRASHGSPQVSGQPIRAVTTSDVTAPRARQQPRITVASAFSRHQIQLTLAFRNSDSTRVRRFLPMYCK